MIPLFRQYPALRDRLPYVPLGAFPTPVERLSGAGKALGVERLYVKRDDLSGTSYGGNKVRKLEFLLGHALAARARGVVTVGFAGSNHALATALYARRLGLDAASLLLPQANAHYVRRNLLAGHHYGAHLRPCKSWAHVALGVAWEILRGMLQTGRPPAFIPGGGSCPLGAAGYVNAALELKEQVAAGELPEPDLIYVALGSMGTATGLLVGCRAAGLKSRVVPVRVVEARLASTGRMVGLANRTSALLTSSEPAFPRMTFRERDLGVRDDCLGEGYARFTEKGARAAELLRREEGIVLNGCYTAKAFSAVLDDAARQALGGKVVLFWNTYNSRDLAAAAARVEYRRLPRAFHRYFEDAVQPLDADGPDR